jgi:pimeloyl-ACP methyl ester carboxylesterase
MREEAVSFGSLKSLVGVVTNPTGEDKKHDKTAIILLNPGIVHRVGAGRVYVKLARTLASMGFMALRFDFSGIGDSAVRRDNLQFEKSAITEAREAMDFLAETTGVDHFILLGGCSGAKIALDTACCDGRVIGVLLINFPSSKDEDLAANAEVIHRGASFYYRKYALFNFTSWYRLITGKASYRKLFRALWFEAKRSLTVREDISNQAQQFQASLRRLANRGVQATFLCSEGDPRLEDLRAAGGNELRRLCAEQKIALEIIRRSDHTFSSLQDQNQLMSVLIKRADSMVPSKKGPSNEYDAITDTSNALLHQLQS